MLLRHCLLSLPGRSDDFLHGVSAMPKSSQVDGLTKAERLRLVHNLITGTLEQVSLE